MIFFPTFKVGFFFVASENTIAIKLNAIILTVTENINNSARILSQPKKYLN